MKQAHLTIDDKKYAVVDTPNNVKKIVKTLKAINDIAVKDDTTFLEVENETRDLVLKGVADLFDLSAEEAKALDDISYSDTENVYYQACQGFTGFGFPTVERISEIASGEVNEEDDSEANEDPK